MDLQKLKNWFLENKRDFPWRGHPTPYQVFISEIMLQQTRASVVIGYYLRWMERFPTLRDLAIATEEEVIKIWEGLGYYARARALHRAAKWILHHHQGSFPSKKEELEMIPGIGPYTSGAIRSFAFRQKAPAIDGNVARVLSRYIALDLEVSTSAAKREFHNYLEELLTDEYGWIEMEALIELGATHCNRNPQCHRCPLHLGCKSRLAGTQKNYPIKKKPKKTIKLSKEILCVFYRNEVLVRKNPKGQIMADLWEFPGEEDLALSEEIKNELTLKEKLIKVKHSFTYYEISLYPSVWTIASKREFAGYEWKTFNDLFQYPFSAGHRKILQQIAALSMQA